MEAPPQPPPPPTATPAQTLYSDSAASSPRSLHSDADAPPSQPKLRLMCSYGGHIVPRPHDKTLCYVGGETRIIVIDRHTSLADLHHRLSRNLLQNQNFSLKYQLPNEDLDSLISVSSDEDLENLVEEYDRLINAAGGESKSKPNRLRLFLFPILSSASSSIDQIGFEIGSIKSEDWFFNALNGKSSSSSRSNMNTAVVSDDRDRGGFSDTSSVNNLLGLDLEAVTASSKVPETTMLERTSSFGSTSSSPSTANLPPIRTRVEETPKAGASGIEEQLQQMSVGNVNLPPAQKVEEVGGFVATGTVAPGLPVVVGGGEYAARISSDDERSDHGGYRKVQQVQQQQVQAQLQIPQFQQIPSPDSVSSEGSITNPLSRQRQAIYQEQFQTGNTRFSANQIDPKAVDQNNAKIQNQPQAQEFGYVLSPQYDQNHPQMHQQQQFIHANPQYIPPGAMPMPSYYPLYPSQQQPMMYYPSTAPQTRNIPASKPEMAAGAYRTSSPQIIQVPSNQHQAQYINYAQFHHPSQSMTPSAVNSAYAYEMTDPSHAPMYYTPLPPQMAAQYPTVTSTGLPDGSGQLPTESTRTLQP